MRRFVFTAFFSLALFACTTTAQAQLLPTQDITINIFPQTPQPNQAVTLKLSSNSINLQAAYIAWSTDGVIRAKGTGTISYTFTTKSLGTKTEVSVDITPVGDNTITQKVTVTPTSTDILWQALDSTVPPFYRGKAMPTSESIVKFVAIPQIRSAGSLLSEKNLFYTWKKEYNPVSAQSGYGKNSFVATMDYLNPTMHVSVESSTVDGTLGTAGSTSLSPQNPRLILYPESPLYGTLFNQALAGEYTVEGSDSTITAEPYFFSPGDPTSHMLSYIWTLSGSKLGAGTGHSLSLHRDDLAKKGDTTLSLSVTNTGKLFQEGQAGLTLHLK